MHLAVQSTAAAHGVARAGHPAARGDAAVGLLLQFWARAEASMDGDDGRDETAEAAESGAVVQLKKYGFSEKSRVSARELEGSACSSILVGLTERALHSRYARSSVQLVEAPDASCRHRAPQTWSHVAKLRARDVCCIQSTCSCTTGFPQLHPAPRQSDLDESMTPLKVVAEATILWMVDCSAARVHDRTCNCDLGGSSRCGCGWRQCKQPAGIA